MAAFISRLGQDVVFAEGGNGFGTLPGSTAVLGTTDGNALGMRVISSRVMRYEPHEADAASIRCMKLSTS